MTYAEVYFGVSGSGAVSFKGVSGFEALFYLTLKDKKEFDSLFVRYVEVLNAPSFQYKAEEILKLSVAEIQEKLSLAFIKKEFGFVSVVLLVVVKDLHENKLSTSSEALLNFIDNKIADDISFKEQLTIYLRKIQCPN